ncbi:MAG TPA: tetratricopeptide repeat protein [Terriglobales bacterium]|nr:tetratricopeptide repeat protein [Terriglobales bacterium]
MERLKQLFVQQHWQEIISVAESSLRTVSQPSADFDYYYGMALAHAARPEDAARIFESAARRFPRDKRFPEELAGIAFQQKNYPRAAACLHRTLRLDPTDSYANEFLATIYFLQENLEAALKYWNRVDKPHIENVLTEPKPRLDAQVLDSAFALSPAETLLRGDLLTTDSRLAALEIFPTSRFELIGREDGNFDLTFRSQERNGWGSSTLDGLAGLFRGLPYQTIYPALWNLKDKAVNLQAMLRWDAEKRRAQASLSSPLHRNAKWRYRLSTDLRNENWDIRPSFTGPSPLLGALNLRREAGSIEIAAFPSGHWNWSTGVELSQRDFRSVVPGVALTPQLLSEGFQLKHTATLNYALLRIPEKRFTLQTAATSQLGRIWSSPSHVFEKLHASLTPHWFPQSRGEDYETYGAIRAGKTFGDLPFDELSMLGVERDNDLWLRAHIGTRDGKKGSAPLGRNFFLADWETDKVVYSNGLLTLKLGPFLDTGKITDPSPALGSKKWLSDTGVQAKARLLGVVVGVSYGKDLRSGHNAIYTTVGR